MKTVDVSLEKRWIWRWRRAYWSTVVRTSRRTEIFPAPTKEEAAGFTEEIRHLFGLEVCSDVESQYSASDR